MSVTVSLAALDSTDMGLVRSWRNQHEIWKYCRQHDFISDAEQVRWFNRQSEDPTIKMYKVMVKSEVADGKMAEGPVGVCGLTSINYLNRTAEFSLYISPPMQNRGLGKVALRVLLEHGFMNLGLNHIFGETFETNPAQKMFESIGFKKDGTRRAFYFRDGRFIDAYLYSILAEEFYASRAHHQPDAQPASGGGGSVVHLPRAHPEGSDQPDQCGDQGAAREDGEEEADQS